MRKEFIYSVSALAAFPIVANADNVIAASKIAVTAEKGAEVTLAKGKYIIKGTVTGKGTLTVGGKEVKLTDGEGKFTLTAQEKVTIAVTGDLKLADATIELDYNFAKVVELLNIEYNKVTQVLSVAQYENSGDAQEYSKLYDRIAAIAGADYKFYLDNMEDVQKVEDQTEVTGMKLYTDIAAALEAVTAKEKEYQEEQLGGLDDRYTKLGYPYNDGNKELDNAKAAAKKAVDAIDSTVDKIKAAQSAIETYGKALTAAEDVKKVNETAYSELNKALTGVDTYYNTILTQIGIQYNDGRYAKLKTELEEELDKKYKERSTVKNDIDGAREKKTVAAKKDDLLEAISKLKDDLTRIFSKYNTAKDKLAGAYATYDTENEKAGKLSGDDFLASSKAAVDKAVGDLLTFIEGNDSYNTVANLTDEAIAAKVKAITDATNKYNARLAIYNDYKALKTAVGAQTKALGDATTAIDKYAKDTKKLSIVPSTIWNTTVEAITDQINTLETNVDANKTTADKYKANKAYTDAQSAITSAINALKANANEATDLYATINGKIGDANKLLGELDKIKANLEALNVWKNQVTIDEAIKARTPYVDFIGDDGSVRESISTWTGNLAAAVGKTAVLNDKKDNKDNILVYLKSLGTAADALKSEIQTMTDIKNNNQTDEDKFKEQIDLQEAAGIRTMIDGKVKVFEGSIAKLKEDFTSKNVGTKGVEALNNGVTIKDESGKETKTLVGITEMETLINAAKTTTATKKDELSEVYKSIKDLDTKIDELRDYAKETLVANFAVFTARYNSLKGDATNPASRTLNGLNAKVKAEKANIDKLGKLSSTQKETQKNYVDGVSVTQTEGKDNKKITYTIKSVADFVEKAWQNEELMSDDVTKYADIIGALEKETGYVTSRATDLNELEIQLATTNSNITTATNGVKAVFTNEKVEKVENNYYYRMLTDANTAGTYVNKYNSLKTSIESYFDNLQPVPAKYVTDIDNLKKQINENNTEVNNAASNAKSNLTTYNGVKDSYATAESVYKKALEDLKNHWTTKYDAQKQKIDTEWLAIGTEKNKADELYKNGNSSTSCKDNIIIYTGNIESLWKEYIDPANYNAQVAADNQTDYKDVVESCDNAEKVREEAAALINSYKNLRSFVLANVVEDKAGEQVQNLLKYLPEFDEALSNIRKDAETEYTNVKSPDKYDKSQFDTRIEEIVGKLNQLKSELSGQVEMSAQKDVNDLCDKYNQQIEESKGKVKNFTVKEGDERSDIAALYEEIDGLLKDVNAVKDNYDDLKALDNALVDAESIGTKIDELEETTASKVLNALLGDWWIYLDESDHDSYSNTVKYIAAKKSLVDRFDEYRAELTRLKNIADKNKADQTAISNAKTAIQKANNLLKETKTVCDGFAAGYFVKETLDQIAADLSQHVEGKVTKDNANAEKEAADNISKRIENVYGDLYDQEVKEIKLLLQKAEDENVTYGGSDKDNIKKNIDAQNTNLKAVEAAVAKKPTEQGYRTKKNALTESTTNLANIEKALNGYIKTMTSANGTDKDADIVIDLQEEVKRLQTRLNNALKPYDSDIQSALIADKQNIQVAINDLSTYINDHKNNMSAYKQNADKKVEDIEAAIVALIDNANAKQDYKNDEIEKEAQKKLSTTIKEIKTLITNAKDAYTGMDKDLVDYDNKANYANRVENLKVKLDEAQDKWDNAQGDLKAEDKTTAQKQTTADKLYKDVNEALNNVVENCNDIRGLARTNYVDNAITVIHKSFEPVAKELKVESWETVLSWKEKDNDNLSAETLGKYIKQNPHSDYTNTDYTTLLTELWNIVNAVESSEKNARTGENVVTAEDVKEVLSKCEDTFSNKLGKLQKHMKDMSLVANDGNVKGQINNDGKIDSGDLMALINIVLNPDSDLDLNRYDINGDGEVDVTDLVWLRYFLVHHDWPTATAKARGGFFGDSNNVKMKVVSNSNNVTRVAVNLNNDTEFNHFQFNLLLPAGAKVVGQSLGERVEGANLMMSQNEGIVRLLAISSANNVFAGNEGAVLYLDVENLNGDLTIEKAVFTGTDFNSYTLVGNGETTGIRGTVTNAIESAGETIYNLGGKVMNGLKKGINIIRRADGTTEKVVKK